MVVTQCFSSHGPLIALAKAVQDDRHIPFELHPDHTVQYQGDRVKEAKLINGVWYRRNGNCYERFALQSEVHPIPDGDNFRGQAARTKKGERAK